MNGCDSGFVTKTLRTFSSNPFFSPAEQVTILSKKLVDWLRYASIVQGGGASSGGFFMGPRSRQVSNLDSTFGLRKGLKLLVLIRIFLFCFPASAYSGAGWLGVRGLLHRALCGAGIHRRPVDERLFLFNAAPLAHHLPLRYQRQQHNGHRYDQNLSSSQMSEDFKLKLYWILFDWFYPLNSSIPK